MWKLSLESIHEEEREGSFADPRQTQMEGGEGWRERCSMVCVFVCACVCVGVCAAPIYTGLKCGLKTLMIPCPLTKRPHHCAALTHSTHITHCQICTSRLMQTVAWLALFKAKGRSHCTLTLDDKQYLVPLNKMQDKTRQDLIRRIGCSKSYHRYSYSVLLFHTTSHYYRQCMYNACFRLSWHTRCTFKTSV